MQTFNAPASEEEVVHVDVKALTVAQLEVFLGILQQERSLAHAPCALNAYQAVVPVNLVHQQPTDRRIDVLHQVAMCSEECLHAFGFILVYACKGTNKSPNCKAEIAKSYFFCLFVLRLNRKRRFANGRGSLCHMCYLFLPLIVWSFHLFFVPLQQTIE